MPAPSSFPELIRRARTGDDVAWAELVRQFEPEIRRYIRFRLTSPALKRLKDSGDIFQSVAAIFFVRVAAGGCDLDDPGQLVKLLKRMAKNKIIDAGRKAENRVTNDAGSAVWAGVAGGGQTPSRILAARELWEEARRRMTDDERRLVQMRADGMKWDDIAAAVGKSPDAVRKQFVRACDRVSEGLGLSGADDA
jgi:RNA polymerase sigma-70 factor (ECF subfamily)